ncbi:GerAB/ArcD/ProY family transporter [Paenisporosarcina sp. NPDC076898]|uniref:GerAB/ArcD/ProY family transporter n=1 Tax=unclassified Paenisporosarcina TaxID=2642018 RepID=UPI003D061D84
MNHSISRWQLVLLVISFIYGSSLLMAPGITAAASYRDAWISMLLAVVMGLLLNVFWMMLLKRYNYLSIFSIVENVTGKWVGMFINLLIVFYGIHLAAYIVRNLSNFMVINVIPDSNEWTYQIMIILLAIYSCYYGLNNMASVNEFLLPWMLLLFGVSVALIANKFDISQLKPVLNESFLSITHGAYNTLGFPFIEIILLGAVFTFVTQKEKLMKSYLMAILSAGFILVFTVFLTVGTEGPYMVTRITYSTYAMMKDITIIELFERVEVVIAVVWIFGILVKICLCLFAVLKGLQHISKHENYHPFLLPVGIITWVMSNEIHRNTRDFTDFVAKYWTLWWFTLYVILVLIMMIGIALKKDKQT